jgi:hypothetical protein
MATEQEREVWEEKAWQRHVEKEQDGEIPPYREKTGYFSEDEFYFDSDEDTPA